MYAPTFRLFQELRIAADGGADLRGGSLRRECNSLGHSR